MSERNKCKIILSTDKPTISIMASTWKEFREKSEIEYKMTTGKNINWKKSEFILRKIFVDTGPQKIDISLNVPISLFPTNLSSELIEFDGNIRGKIVEK